MGNVQEIICILQNCDHKDLGKSQISDPESVALPQNNASFLSGVNNPYKLLFYPIFLVFYFSSKPIHKPSLGIF